MPAGVEATWLDVAPEVAERWPGVGVVTAPVLAGTPEGLAGLVEARWQRLHDGWVHEPPDAVTGHPYIAAYRQFARALGLDPDRHPPSVQMLIDRGLRGRPPRAWPRIAPIVDAVNVVAVDTLVALGAFDAAKLAPPVHLVLTSGGEPFHALGSKREVQLAAGELVLRDRDRVLSLFARRDGIFQAITPQTRRVLVLGCAVAGVDGTAVAAAVRDAVDLLAEGRPA
jgi:DNA/RNA-binding domain of Phe-tRNA-synthetase-like protein